MLNELTGNICLILHFILGMRIWWVVCAIASTAAAGGVHTAVDNGGRWRWPEGQDVRIDTKVQFLDASTAANRATSDKSVTASVHM